MLWILVRGGHAFFRLWRYWDRRCFDAWHIIKCLQDNDWALSRQVVYPIIVGAFAISIVPVNSNCRPSGEISVNACLMARSGDTVPNLEHYIFILFFIPRGLLFYILTFMALDGLLYFSTSSRVSTVSL